MESSVYTQRKGSTNTLKLNIIYSKRYILASIGFYLHRIDAQPNEIDWHAVEFRLSDSKWTLLRYRHFQTHTHTVTNLCMHAYLPNGLLATWNWYQSAVCIFPLFLLSEHFARYQFVQNLWQLWLYVWKKTEWCEMNECVLRGNLCAKKIDSIHSHIHTKTRLLVKILSQKVAGEEKKPWL